MTNKTLKLRKMTLISLIAFLGLIMLSNCKASTTVPLVYLDPPTIVGTAINQEFNVTIYGKDFTNLYMWQAGLRWDPNILQGIAIYADTTLSDDVFDVLAPTNQTMWFAGTFDNTKGTLGYSAQNLKGVANGVTGTPGTSYKFMVVKFKVKAVGTSDIHLSDVSLGKPEGGYIVEMPVNILDIFTVNVAPTTYTVQILTNSTSTTYTNIFGHTFAPADNALRFNITSVKDRTYATNTKGFCNVTIPKNLMWVDSLSDWTVKVNDAAPLSLTPTEDANNYYIYFTYAHTGTLASPAVLRIEIKSTHAIPEFPTTIILVLFLVATLAMAISGKLLISKPKS